MAIRKEKQILQHHVEKAALFWEESPGYSGFRDSTTYDVLVNGRPYPPKAIAAISSRLAGLGELMPSDFAGVKDGKWHRLFKSLGFLIVPKGTVATQVSEIGQSAFIESDIEEIDRAHQDNPTVRATLVMARLGQGKYRKELLALWDGKCAVTGCAVSEVLRASHAKPWRISNDSERLDPNNGLPLVANLDALFDAGLIGFDEDGKMRISEQLSDEETLLGGIPRHLRVTPNVEQASYLEDHLANVFRCQDEKLFADF
ncbi:HNH endonuclease [Herbaspirillum frisingense]|uniref:HNH endonuclease n=1 Tax=Herbaspirillum frisingense TaxID=92645 RepID=UPI00160252AF|nr:HNH endonuclease [Herbaspirillum frisingense]QNB05762.1 HNH endonuclease [Herbaspirillum frisingense]